MLLNHNLRIRAENMNKFMNKYDDIKKLIPTRTIELKPILITPFQVYKEESNQQETKKIILQPHTHVEEDEIIETPQIKEPIDYQPIHESTNHGCINKIHIHITCRLQGFPYSTFSYFIESNSLNITKFRK